jgi:hypothetical protein
MEGIPMANDTGNGGFGSPRAVIALVVSSVALIGIIGFGIVDMLKSSDAAGAAKDVLTMTLPVLGTWVATVLAYYFHKENLDAATKSITDVVKYLTPQEKLQSISVKDKMIPKDKIVHGKLPADKIIFSKVLQEMDTKDKGDRYPIFDEDDHLIKFMIHRSWIDKYLTEQALKGLSSVDLSQKTLKNILDNPDDNTKYGKPFQSSFATVRENATLLDAKTQMDQAPDCQDVFVTKGGTKDDDVVGWITNVIIADNSKV